MTCTFVSTGSEQHFTVPTGVTSIDIVAIGGKAGAAFGYDAAPGAAGFGAVTQGTLAVTPGDKYYIEVGGNGAGEAGGFNGGGNGHTDYDGGNSGGGGGASDVRTVTCGSPCNPTDYTSLTSRLLIAGGGGGGGNAFNDAGGNGGSAGSTAANGADGADTGANTGSGGKGGGGADADVSPGGGGAAGGACDANGVAGTDGTYGAGGYAQIGGTSSEPGGGGGGGYYGGGAGGGGSYCSGQDGGGGGGGAGSSWVDPSVTSSNIATDATGVPSITIKYTATDQPDGRIRVGSHPFSGGNVYNSDGTGQSVAKNAVVGARILFRVQVQNDGNGPDQYTFHATGSAAPGYRIRYYWKSHEITSEVVAGTFTTPKINVGDHYVIEAWVKVTSTAGASASRLVTITSVGDGSTVDAVKFKVNRSN